MSGEISGILSGALIQEMRMDVLANNMANASTVGFKEDRVFRIPEVPSPAGDDTSGASPSNLPVNMISDLPVGSFTNHEQGPLKETGNALDMALVGEGFFSVQTSQGLQYTRKGNFVLNADGMLVTQEGYPVLGKSGGEIQISGREIVVGDSGAIVVDGAEVDSLSIVNFADKNGLLKTGNSLYSPLNPDDTGEPAEMAVVHQGFVEGSNVDPIKIMTEMIDVIRGYESYQKVIQSMNEINAKGINEIGTLS